MIDLAELRRLHRVTRFDFWIAVAAILGVLSAGVLAGVVIGIVLSLGWLIYVATRPPMPLLGREPGTQVFRDLDENPDDETLPGHRRPAARRRPVLRHRGGARGSHPRPRRRPTGRCARSCSTSRASTSSTRRASAKLTEILELTEADGRRAAPRAREAARPRGAPRRRDRRPDRRRSRPRQRPPRRPGRARRSPWSPRAGGEAPIRLSGTRRAAAARARPRAAPARAGRRAGAASPRRRTGRRAASRSGARFRPGGAAG